MKKLLVVLFFLPVVAFAGGSHHEKKQPPVVTPVVTPVLQPPTSPSAPVSIPAPQSNGGGWAGGCSHYAEGTLPWWGVVPCTPTSSTQPPEVTPESLRNCSGPHPTCIRLSNTPVTGYAPSLPQYVLDLFEGMIQFLTGF